MFSKVFKKDNLWYETNYHESFKNWIYLPIIFSFIMKQLIFNSYFCQ